jgi:segregation and condensation protein B
MQEYRLKVKQVIESLLFASSEPIPLNKIREITDEIYSFKPKVLFEIIHELQAEYDFQQRAFCLEEIAQGFILRTRMEFGSFIEQLYRNRRTEKLSQAATEVLAIIAYRQPVTRPQIDAIRGVDSSAVLAALIERQLVESVGKLEAPGRPTLYGITKDFLKHYGLRDLTELPQIAVSFANK